MPPKAEPFKVSPKNIPVQPTCLQWSFQDFQSMLCLQLTITTFPRSLESQRSSSLEGTLLILTHLGVPDNTFYAQESSLFPKGDFFFGERYSSSLVRLLLMSFCPFSLRLWPAPLNPGKETWHKIRCFTHYKDPHRTVPNSQESPLGLTGLN